MWEKTKACVTRIVDDGKFSPKIAGIIITASVIMIIFLPTTTVTVPMMLVGIVKIRKKIFKRRENKK